jgi:hypothetical protein
MTRAIWVNAEKTIGNVIDEKAGAVTVIEPGLPGWDEFAARGDIEPYAAPLADASVQVFRPMYQVET